MSNDSVRSWLSLIAQKNGTFKKYPLRLDWPNCGGRKPVCRSRRMAAAKNGRKGISGTSLTQNEAFVP